MPVWATMAHGLAAVKETQYVLIVPEGAQEGGGSDWTGMAGWSEGGAG